MSDYKNTLLYKESLESSSVVSAQLEQNMAAIGRLKERFASKPPKLLVTSARGSSYHATTYARSLFELELGILSTASTPSVNTIYNQKLDMKDMLFLTVSQSGESPDLIMQAKAAKESGAFVLAIVNNVDSTLSSVADEVLGIHAGPEKSVAATKSYIGSLTNIALLVARLKDDSELISSINSLPKQLEAAAQIDWASGLPNFENATSAFILGRGPSLAVASEAALKMKETCCIHAEAFSSAEVKHGPMTLIQNDFPLLMFNPRDESYEVNAQFIQSLAERDPNLLVVDNNIDTAYSLSTGEYVHPRLDPILMIQTFYPFVASLALLKGFDPDNPKYLSKVTRTV